VDIWSRDTKFAMDVGLGDQARAEGRPKAVELVRSVSLCG